MHGYPFDTTQDVAERVKDLAWTVERHACPAVDGDNPFMAIMKTHIAWGPEGALAAEHGSIQEAGERAERARPAEDYAEAARLYAEVPADKLSLVESRKSSIAHRKVQPP